MSKFKSTKKFMYDLAVIGAGSGGVRAARIAGTHGASVALVESSLHHGPPTYTAIGGTCVNVGCVPKKLLVYGSHFNQMYEDSRGYGWSPAKQGLAHNWGKLIEKKNTEIDRLNGIYGRILGSANVETVVGHGSLKDKHTVIVKDPAGATKEITAETILVAVGGWPFKPDIPGIEHAITSNEVFYLPERPERVLIVGGGYIAVEFACILNGYGSKVTQMYRGPLFLRGFDGDVRAHLAEEMKKEGVDVRFKENPKSITKLDSGAYKVVTEAGTELEVDCVMYATGRVPKVDGLGLANAGVETTGKGVIKVDENSKTNVSNIYAVGDVTDRMQLTPVALNEGHCFADMLYGGMKERKPDHEYVASAVFSQPEIGTVGFTEEQAVEKFKDITVYKSTFKPMMHTLTGKDTKALMKLIVDDKSDRVVGVHMCGDHAAEILQGIGIAVKMGATKKDFDRTIGIHPSSAEEFVTMRTPAYKYKDGAKL